MASLLKSALKSIRERGLGNFLRELREEGYLSCLADGNLLRKEGRCRDGALAKGHRRASGGGLRRLNSSALRKEISRQTKIHNIGATLVGVDKFGNKYYEKLGETQYGRHRWVEYALKDRYNASQVPAEWHGWLHFITDHTGDELLMLKPKRYGVEHKENLSGEGDEYIYHSKGHSLNPGQRDWTRSGDGANDVDPGPSISEVGATRKDEVDRRGSVVLDPAEFYDILRNIIINIKNNDVTRDVIVDDKGNAMIDSAIGSSEIKKSRVGGLDFLCALNHGMKVRVSIFVELLCNKYAILLTG
ncbi:hypothetical protein TEA_011825 [Camellia sinensis var. sinensis]|uniref:NADH dehydrogenase [ubiquinone] 1 alpha subcomplex subunit 12 n=1 Tax=Camellia sinensis var. sinensis TaxID=542762 RepID=A0A4S4DQR2_CAMSN|nr:hypothetical protein TEA_011825 [Camellia sinensis var. sinensis]